MSDLLRPTNLSTWQDLDNEDTLFAALAQGNRDPLLILDYTDDASGKIVFANEAAIDTFGHSASEFRERWFSSLACCDSPHELHAPPGLPAANKPLVVEREFQRRDGTRFAAKTEFRSLQWEGHPLVIAVIQSGSSVNEQDLKRRFDLARVAPLISLGQLAARITHEITQPIYAIANYNSACANVLARAVEAANKLQPAETDGARRAPSTDGSSQSAPNQFSASDASNLQEWMQQIALQSARAGDALRNLAHYTRSVSPQVVAVDSQELVRDALRTLCREIEESRCRVELAIDSMLEQVLCEPLLVEQILTNLIRSSLQGLGSVDDAWRRIVIRIRQLEKHLEFAVVDFGPTFEFVESRNIFDSFFKTAADRRGQGLAISRILVETFGGRLWAEKNSGPGMSVFFTLPFKRSVEPITNVL